MYDDLSPSDNYLPADLTCLTDLTSRFPPNLLCQYPLTRLSNVLISVRLQIWMIIADKLMRIIQTGYDKSGKGGMP